MNAPEYTAADMRRQHAAWRLAAHHYLCRDPHNAMLALLGDRNRPPLELYCDMVAMSTLGASLTGQIIAARLAPGERLGMWRLNPTVEPTGAETVASAMVVNAGNGELHELVTQVNAWGCFDAAGIGRMTDLLAWLLDMFCEASG